MIDYKPFLENLTGTSLEPLQTLGPQVEAGLDTERFGDLSGWYAALVAMPEAQPSGVELKSGVTIGLADDLSYDNRARMEACLKQLMPWRKGPLEIFGLNIDTEWRSDWKWQRVLPFLQPLAGRKVLDVGCGNGYHCLRMYGEGAAEVLGIDPSPRFVIQFQMLRRYLKSLPVEVLPLALEALPSNLEAFDTTFSMGVLYHRRSPMDHLRELKDTLVPGGELVLETLIADGPLGHTLVPERRYAMMGNVWFIPSVATLESWLKKSGFIDVRTVDINVTSLQEQRRTAWMTNHSLREFLDPQDLSKTAEGHPAPTRAIVLARKPE